MDYQKKHEHLVCIDSDGTAIDSMTVKHKKCFGPCFVKEWGLESQRENALSVWDSVNLYGKTRGKNRFLTLLECLEYYRGSCISAEDLSVLANWVQNTGELSNESLKKELAKKNNPVLFKALNWSVTVNYEIANLTFDDIRVFDGVKDFLAFAKNRADIAVVSSANLQAVTAEWSHYGLADYVDAIATQEIGSKQDCINELMKKGYKKENILMIGDAPPDLFAATASGVLFYPIITGQERASWADLKNYYFDAFLKGTYNQELFLNKFESTFAS